MDGGNGDRRELGYPAGIVTPLFGHVRFKPCFTLTVLLLLAGAVTAQTEFDLVNRLRAQAGLPALSADEALSAAAALHARYLDRHREPGKTAQGLSAHTQRAGVPDFSGATPADRAQAAGYPHREVLENVSMGFTDAASAVSGLMSAIYHRFTFLDLEADQLGVAAGERSRVFLLGRADIGRLCRSLPHDARYLTPVDCLGRTITRDYYTELCADLPQTALFRAPHPISCPNGTRLDADFMAGVCDAPPRTARFPGHGRYYVPCENGTRVSGAWFDELCEKPPAAAAYAAGGSYYEICDGPRRVHAEWLEAQCAALPERALYRDSGRYRRPCGADVDVRVEFLDHLDAARLATLPDVVLWPPPGATDIPPAFFVEDPDPLPDVDVSGYPVSIQFNPGRNGTVRLNSFRLFRVDGDERTAVDALPVLDRVSDPHQLLTGYEFALFPRQRLQWGATYVAVVEASLGGASRRFEWQFETQGRGMPLLTATRPQQRFTLQPGVDYLLYLPPREGGAYTVLSSRTQHLRGNTVTQQVVDPNTLRIRIDVRGCDRISMQFDAGRSVELIPAGCGG